ncbi:MAG: response regulator [Oscillospiraceae bacterium]|jgi:putative two-component system response regulator|nr:response regulator [Oscillospiraceae bacterium]
MFSDRKNILVVDDDNIVLMLVHGLLKDAYQCVPVRSGAEALQYLEQNSVDLMLVDVEMPAMSGQELARAAHAMPQQARVPIILMTGMMDIAQPMADMNDPCVVDIVRKPFQPAALQRMIALYLELFDLRAQAALVAEEQARAALNERNLLTALFANLVEYRDQPKGLHIQRMQAVTRKIILGYNTLFPDRLIAEEDAARVVLCCQLHDIGKVAIADAILLKPGRLTPEEYDIMKKHTVYGAQALETPDAQDPDGMLATARQIALCHHEKWDGSGYSRGLRGEQIPLAARIVAVADVLDAMISLRPYRRSRSFDQTLQSMLEARGKHFDPDIIDAFLDQKAAIQDIYLSFAEKINP